MPTRVKRPSILLKLSVTAGLVAFQGYLGYHLLTGTFGLESQKDMLAEIEVLKARQAALDTEIEAYRHRIALFEPQRLDPDIITERSRELLGLVHPDDIIIVPDDTK
ncbi:FtsB family cell division protein [Pelagibacterium xiamenense]|uniref:FtsB family cell division protein n=1 Tax=Pelagibacterium xiamenense TaxID=2901140 RepID=UPI001E532624|nr:septum formation initiator family protein [Pelagibacterium xiamenense]MCD7060978.1 septum formation initiator family protein [Pelagibacterium xiamenense]